MSQQLLNALFAKNNNPSALAPICRRLALYMHGWAPHTARTCPERLSAFRLYCFEREAQWRRESKAGEGECVQDDEREDDGFAAGAEE